MKNQNIPFLLLLLLGFLLNAQLQAQETIKPADPFDGLYATGNIEVLLTKGDENKVELYVDGMPYDKVAVKVQRGILKLRVLESWLYKNEVIKAYVTYKSLNLIRANAGAKIESEELIKTGGIELRVSSGARIELSLNIENLEGSASEGGILDLEGETIKQDVTVSTGAYYAGLAMDAQQTYIRTNTGGQAEVVAIELLDAAANTGGTIKYKGEPENKYVKTVIAGEVRRY